MMRSDATGGGGRGTRWPRRERAAPAVAPVPGVPRAPLPGVLRTSLLPSLCCSLLLTLAAAACGDADATGKGSAPPPAGATELVAVPIASGLEAPVHVSAPAGDDRVFIVEQPGRIRVVRDGAVLPTPFLDITDRVRSGGERGLLSVAFHPDFASSGRFYVDYTDTNGDTRIARFRTAPGSDVTDPASESLVLFVEQPFANHNGGLVAFGPDGMLYVGMGDGGGGGDPLEAGQDLDTLLGKLLRLDVDAGSPYGIPADNPFVGRSDARPEIWAYGLRNPWRYAWDRADGLLWIADVGQNRLEELNARPADAAGLNYGWDIMEGDDCFEPSSGCDRTGLVAPVHVYDHDDGCSVTGGHVYRGQAIPALQGHYFYADWCGGWVRSFRLQAGSPADHREWALGDIGRVTSFGEDASGELYLTSGNGSVYRLEAAAGASSEAAP